MLSDKQKSSLKQFLQSPAWETISYIMEEYQRRVASRSTVGDTADDTLMLTYLKEGEMRGISNIKQEIFKAIE